MNHRAIAIENIDLLTGYKDNPKRALARHGDALGIDSIEDMRAITSEVRGIIRNGLPDGTPDKRIDLDRITVSRKGQDLVRTVDELIAEVDLDLEKWEITKFGCKTPSSAMKDADGNPMVIRTWNPYIEARPRTHSTSLMKVPVSTPVVRPPLSVKASNGDKVILIVPDSQHGFLWNNDFNGVMPLHDTRAIDAVAQLAEFLQPDEIIDLGDGVDFAEMSRYDKPANVMNLMNHALWAKHQQFRDYAERTSADIKVVYGNHDIRIKRTLEKLAPGLNLLRKVGESRPVLDIHNLLSLDEIGVANCADYGETHEDNRTTYTHDIGVAPKSGQTVMKALERYTTNVVGGHIHRAEMACKTVFGYQVSEVITAISPGCLCRTDDYVPGNGGRRNWQTACAVQTLHSDGTSDFELVLIRDGVLRFRGFEIEGKANHEWMSDMLGIKVKWVW